MKKIILVVAIFCSLFANAQKTPKKIHIPHAVKHRFHNHFPAATEIIWGKEKGYYKSSFKIENKDVSVFMNSHGHVEEITHDVDAHLIPVSVNEYMQKHFPGAKVEKVKLIDDLSSTIIFVVDIIENDGSKSELRINNNHYDHIEIRQGVVVF